jgi:hypothetical protein
MRKLGEILIQEGYASQEQLNKALAYQTLSENLLGRIMLDMHFITFDQKMRVLEYQKAHAGERFGEIVLKLGFATRKQLEKAVWFQHSSKGFLGELLMELGIITQEQRDEILKIQFEEAKRAKE